MKKTIALIPLLFTALFLFASLSRMLLGDGLVRLLALGLFAITDSLIYYSADAKQYSIDVASVLLVWICACRFLRAPGGRTALWYGLSGALTLWLSHAALFVLAGTGCALALHFLWKKERAAFALASASGALWVLSLLALYVSALRFQVGNGVLDTYWNQYFAPLPPTSFADLRWYVSAFFGLFTSPFGEGLKLYGLTAFTMLVGFAALARKRGMDVLLLTAPVFFTLLA